MGRMAAHALVSRHLNKNNNMLSMHGARLKCLLVATYTWISG